MVPGTFQVTPGLQSYCCCAVGPASSKAMDPVNLVPDLWTGLRPILSLLTCPVIGGLCCIQSTLTRRGPDQQDCLSSLTLDQSHHHELGW